MIALFSFFTRIRIRARHPQRAECDDPADVPDHFLFLWSHLQVFTFSFGEGGPCRGSPLRIYEQWGFAGYGGRGLPEGRIHLLIVRWTPGLIRHASRATFSNREGKAPFVGLREPPTLSSSRRGTPTADTFPKGEGEKTYRQHK